MPLRALLVMVLPVFGIACSLPPCDPITSTLSSVCHRADAGPMVPDASFVLEGTAGNTGTTCAVTVTDGGLLLEVTGAPVCDTRGGQGLRVLPSPVKCTVPPLAAGTYTVFGPEVTFTLPLTAGGELESCR